MLSPRLIARVERGRETFVRSVLRSLGLLDECRQRDGELIFRFRARNRDEYERLKPVLRQLCYVRDIAEAGA